MKIKAIILKLLTEKGALSVTEMNRLTGFSTQYIHRILKDLLLDNQLIKLGTSPKTVYQIKTDRSKQIEDLPAELGAIINPNFLMVTPTGERLDGETAFNYWCTERNLPVIKTAQEYVRTFKKYRLYKTKLGLIDGMVKLQNTKGIGEIHVDQLYYADFYAIERFGKTKLGQLMHYGKMAQNKALIKEVAELTKPTLQQLIETDQIEAIGYIPPTINRITQFMKEIAYFYNFALPHIVIDKIKGAIPIPQKTFNKLSQRVSNARNSMRFNQTINHKKILLIDDALGSGATINEAAGKIKLTNPTVHITGFAVTGSYKGFEVIAEV